MTFDTINAEEVIIELIVDDGSKNKSHREMLFKDDFGVMGCYSGNHSDFRVMSCIDYAGAFVQQGGPDPIKEAMDVFLREEVDFDKQMPIKMR